MLWRDTWPGGSRVAYSPAIWQRMFEGTEALVKRGFSLSRNVLAPRMV